MPSDGSSSTSSSRIVDQGLGQRQSLQHALAEAGDRLAAAVGQADSFEQFAGRAARARARGHARQAAVAFDQLPGRQIAGKGRVLVDVADLGQRARDRTRAVPAA